MRTICISSFSSVISFLSVSSTLPIRSIRRLRAEDFIGGEYLNLGYDRCGSAYGYDGYFTRGFGIYVLLGRGCDGQHIAFEPGAPAVGFGDGEVFNAFLGNGEVCEAPNFSVSDVRSMTKFTSLALGRTI